MISRFRTPLLRLVIASIAAIASAQQSPLQQTRVSALPSASTNPTSAMQVTDGLNASDCVKGGGAFTVICVAQGGVWAPASQTGIRYARQFQTGPGDNGIAAASSGAANQTVVADSSYGTVERPTTTSFSASPFHYNDSRRGSSVDFFHNPVTSLWKWPFYGPLPVTGQTAACLFDGIVPNSLNSGGCMNIEMISTAPGWSIGNPPVGGGSGWVNRGALAIATTINSAGIAGALGILQTKYGVGDNDAAYFTIEGSHNGWTAPSDEGTKPLAVKVYEDPNTYTGTIASGASRGSTSIKTTAVTDGGSQGVGQYLIDTTQSPVSGTFTAIGSGIVGNSAVTVNVTSGAVTESNAWGTLVSDVQTPLNTSSPFNTSQTFSVKLAGGTTGIFDTTHLVCFSGSFHECAVPTAVGALSGGVQSVTLLLRRPHATGTYVFQGGMAGYGFEQTALNQSPSGQTLRYLLDVVGSTSATTLQIIQFFPVGARAAPINTQLYASANVASGVTNGGSGTTLSFTVAGGGSLGGPYSYVGATFKFSGLSDPALNTACTATVWTSASAGTCTIAGLSGSHASTSGGTMSLALNQFKLWPMAEILDVQNETLSPPQIDGTFQLEPNIIPFGDGDTVESPHHPSALMNLTTMAMTNYDPYGSGAGLSVNWGGTGATGSGQIGSPAMLYLVNSNPKSEYQEYGGIRQPPNAITLQGAYYQGIMTNQGPAKNGSFFNIVPSSPGQYQDATYCFNLWSVYAVGSEQMCPNTGKANGGNVTRSISGIATYAAASHQFNGVVNFTNPINLSKVTSQTMQTIPSAATISPASSFVAISGTAQITTIAVPAISGTISYTGCINIKPTGLWTTATGGNINLASKAVVNRIMVMCYDGSGWNPSY